MTPPPERVLSDRTLSAIVLASAALTGAAGLWVIGRWQIGLPPLVEAYRDQPPMQPLAALCLTLWSIALFAASQRMRTLANLASLALIGFVTLRLYQALIGQDYEIDRLLFPNAFPSGSNHLRVRGGMVEATAFNFIFLSISVLVRPCAPRTASGLLIVPAAICAASLGAVLGGVTNPNGVLAYVVMAPATALGLLLATVGALCLDPRPRWLAGKSG
jgi:hypothetical protein